MVLLVSKVVGGLASPLGVVIALSLIGLAYRRRFGWWVVGLAVVVLWGASMPLSGDWMLGRLEAEYPARPIAALPHVDAAIVLGGSLGQPLPPRFDPDLSDAADRVLYAARLFRAGKVDAILVSGGNLPRLVLQPVSGTHFHYFDLFGDALKHGAFPYWLKLITIIQCL